MFSRVDLGQHMVDDTFHFLLHVLASLYPILCFPFGAKLSLSTVSSSLPAEPF